MHLTGTGPRQRRLVAVVDVEAYSGRPYAQQQRVQSRLAQALDYACELAVGGRRRCEQQDRGDGQLLLLPADADEARAVPGLVLGLRDALTTLNAGAAATDRIRLRAALAQGPAQRASLGYVAWSVELACRLLDCATVRSALERTPASDMALIVAADLFRDTFASGGGGMPGSLFRPVRVELPEKRFEADAFVSAVPRGRVVGEAALRARSERGRRRGVLLGGTLLSGAGLCLLLPDDDPDLDLDPAADTTSDTDHAIHAGHGTDAEHPGEAGSTGEAGGLSGEEHADNDWHVAHEVSAGYGGHLDDQHDDTGHGHHGDDDPDHPHHELG
jgi:hypothetical protein